MYKVYYTSESEENLVNIFGYISDDNSFYAAKVISSIKSTIDILKIFPLAGKDIDEEYKIIINSEYKFKIVYKFLDGIIYIISIFKYRNIWE